MSTPRSPPARFSSWPRSGSSSRCASSGGAVSSTPAASHDPRAGLTALYDRTVSDPEEPAPDTLSSLPADAASRLIVDIASAAAGGRDLDQILHETLDRLRSVAPLTGGSIALVEGD